MNRPEALSEENSIVHERGDGSLFFLLVSPLALIREMLTLAHYGPTDILGDLGSGDGRVVIEAAGTYGMRAWGIERNEALVARSRDEANAAGVGKKVAIVHEDFESCDWEAASVLTCHVGLENFSRTLGSRLRKRAHEGARVVTVDVRIPDLSPLLSHRVDAAGNTYLLHLYDGEQASEATR